MGGGAVVFVDETVGEREDDRSLGNCRGKESRD